MKKYTQPQVHIVTLALEKIMAPSGGLSIKPQGTNAPALTQGFETAEWDEDEE